MQKVPNLKVSLSQKDLEQQKQFLEKANYIYIYKNVLTKSIFKAAKTISGIEISTPAKAFFPPNL